MKKLALCTLLALSLLVTPTFAQDKAPKTIKVVASFSILADMVKQIGGGDVDVVALAKAGQDSHHYEPSPQDLIALSEADIIVVNGLKFEGWLHRALKASGSKANLLVTTTGIRPRLLENDHDHHDEDHDLDKDGKVHVDPHAWQNLGNASIYIKNIASALAQANPDSEKDIKARAADYLKQCEQLHANAKKAFAAIPEARRKAVIPHDALGYFGDAYGVTFLAPMNSSADAQTSAAELAGLLDNIQKEGITALFAEYPKQQDKLMQQIAKESDLTIKGELYPDALSDEKGPAPTYIAMMEHNINTILEGLK